MTLLDSSHTFSLTIGGSERWSYLRGESLQLVEAEGAQVDTLTCELEDSSDALTVTEWQEIIWTADGSNRLFGGYVVKAQPKLAPGGQHRIWTVACESYVTNLGRGLRVRKTYVNQTTKAIVADMFTLAGISGFDVTTHVATGATLGLFTTTGDKLGVYLDALARINSQKSGTTWGWRVDASKALWLGPLTSDPAAFAISHLAGCNWSTAFPPSGEPTVDRDATTIINRVTVRGGTMTSDNVTETLTGDGSKTLFALAYKPVRDVVSISVAGAAQTIGTDWYNEFTAGYDVLVNYASGTLRFADADPPANGAEIVIVYRYDTAITAVVTDAASYAQYGRYFDAEISDANLTSLTAAQDAGYAVLTEYAFGVSSGTLTVERLGIRAGQLLTIVFPLLGLNGSYAVRQMTTSLVGSSGVKCEIRYGGHGQRLSSALLTGGGSPAYNPPTAPGLVTQPGGDERYAPRDEGAGVFWMRVSFGQVSWASMALFEKFLDETNRAAAEPSYRASIAYDGLSNGGDNTADRVFTWTSLLFTDLFTVLSGASDAVGSGYLQDNDGDWFAEQYRNYELVDSLGAVFTINACTVTPRRLEVTGTPAAGTYTVRFGLPTYSMVFAVYEDDTTGNTGKTKIEVTYDGGAHWQTYLDTANNIFRLDGAVTIDDPGRSYGFRATLTNDAAGKGPVVRGLLICTDPAVWT